MKKINDLFGLENVKDVYFITTCAKVISLMYGKIRIIKPTEACGYLRVGLMKNDGTRVHVLVHRLVALAYIPNDDKETKVQVNHKDENRKNNVIYNLEWVTPTENLNYGNRSSNSIKTHIDKRDIKYYETHIISRSDFRKRCKYHSWNIEDFDEVFHSYVYRNDKKGKYKMFNYIYVGDGKGKLTENTDLSGVNNPNSKPIEYWESNHTTEYAFKNICIKYGWNYDDFEAIFSCKKVTKTYTKKLYTFKLKSK